MGSHWNYWWYSPLKLHYDYWLRARFRDWKWFWMWDSIMIFDLDVAIIFLSIFKAVTQLQLFLAPPPNYHKMGICNSSHKCAGRILADFWRNSSLERSVNPWSAFYVNSGLFPFSRESWRILENLWESVRILENLLGWCVPWDLQPLIKFSSHDMQICDDNQMQMNSNELSWVMQHWIELGSFSVNMQICITCWAPPPDQLIFPRNSTEKLVAIRNFLRC